MNNKQKIEHFLYAVKLQILKSFKKYQFKRKSRFLRQSQKIILKFFLQCWFSIERATLIFSFIFPFKFEQRNTFQNQNQLF